MMLCKVIPLATLEVVGNSMKELREESSADSSERSWTQEDWGPPPCNWPTPEQMDHPQLELRATFTRLRVGDSLAMGAEEASAGESIMMNTMSSLQE